MIVGKCTDVFRGIFWLGRGVEKRGDMLGELFLEEFFMGDDNFCEESVGFSSAI